MKILATLETVPLPQVRAIDPGRLYNLGNALGFFGGLAAALTAMPSGTGQLATIWGRGLDYAAGSPAAIVLTGATLIFFWGGLAYSKAWLDGSPPDFRLARLGDLLSGGGAILLGIGLLLIGNPVLAASAGALHATGKLGGAIAGRTTLHWSGREVGIADLCEDAVLVSRVPAILAAITGLATADLHSFLLSVNMAACFLIWATADYMLLSRQSLIKAATTRLFRA